MILTPIQEKALNALLTGQSITGYEPTLVELSTELFKRDAFRQAVDFNIRGDNKVD